MRLLLVEDEPRMSSAVEAELDADGVEVVIAATAEDAMVAVATGGFDLIICDLRIPASAAAPEAHKTHGISVYDQVRVIAPGVPVVVFSAYGDMADLGDRFADAAPQDLYGTGVVKIVTCRTKSQLKEVVDLVRDQASQLKRLDDAVELSGVEAKVVMDRLDERVLRIYARKHGGSGVKVRLLAGGKSGATTLRVDVETAQGTSASRAVAKLNDLGELEDEEARYEAHVSPLLNAGTYTNRLETIRAGAQHRGGLFYSLAYGYDESLFDTLRRDPEQAATVVRAVEESLAPWHGSAMVCERAVGDVRGLLVRDAKLGALRCAVDWRNAALEDTRIVVRAARSHGDLHGGNVLVNRQGRPMLIDFGRTGESVNAVDPVMLEMSVILHPDAGLDLGGWPNHHQAERWNDRAVYLEDCPIPSFVRACRDWSDEVSRGDREVDAVVYGVGLRQLLFPDVDHEMASAFSRGAARRLA